DPGRDEEYRFVIGDLGQATPPKKDDNQVFGVLPYIAPEVLCEKPYTQAADICSGLRPEIPSNTPKLYADLMQRCWDGNIEKRPSALEIYSTIGTWLNQCLFVPNSNIAKEFKRGDELNTKLHVYKNCIQIMFCIVLIMMLKEDSKLAIIDNDFEIPDSIDDEDNEDSAFEIPDSLDEDADSLDDVEDSIDNIDLDDIPITPTDESSVLNKLNIENIKKEIVSKPSSQPISSTNDDVKVKEN
ncbi:29522_t:CDS:2, partial [Racocetra persica]